MLNAIGHTTFFSDTLTAVDKMIGNFVQVAYQNFINSNNILITLLITFYMMWVGYRFLAHTHSAEFMSLTRHLVDAQIKNQQQLKDQIDKTDNVKAAADLTNRLQVENNLIQLETLRQLSVSNQQKALDEQSHANAILLNSQLLSH